MTQITPKSHQNPLYVPPNFSKILAFFICNKLSCTWTTLSLHVGPLLDALLAPY